jgi:CheY-like chemotaxis protein
MEASLHRLAGCRVLVVEDEYLIADELGRALQEHGAEMIGPVVGLDEALAVVATEDRIDGAVMDLNLRGQFAFPLADALEARQVPFVFATGYDSAVIPRRYQHVPRWEKPYYFEDLMRAFADLVECA